jgi:F-type H+-transporting ATPase subunit epsilon
VSIELVVVTPEGQAYSGPVDQVVLPGSEGEFGVLESHERFLAALTHGVMEVQTAEGSSFAAVSDGFADVSAGKVVVMVGSHHRADEIDVDAARDAHATAESELRELGASDEEAERRAELEDAITRAQVHIDLHNRTPR